MHGHLNIKFKLNSHSAACFGYVNLSFSPPPPPPPNKKIYKNLFLMFFLKIRNKRSWFFGFVYFSLTPPPPQSYIEMSIQLCM